MQPVISFSNTKKVLRHKSGFNRCLFNSSLLAVALTINLVAFPTLSSHANVISADFSDLVSQVTPGVARVNVIKSVTEEELSKNQTVDTLHQFFGDRAESDNHTEATLNNNITHPTDNKQSTTIEHAYGTAFFVTSDGYMLTNQHVIKGADSITVTLDNRSELDAVLVSSDERSDIAVLKVEGSGFPALPMGDSSLLRVGEPVLAIGSPYGFDYSASSGIVSAKTRNFSRRMRVPFIQTDVALNPGNSGGPLFNQQGEVIGINSRVYSTDGGYMGLSFSIPINEAMEIYQQLRDTGKIEQAYFGAFPQDLDRNLAEVYGLDRPVGALITRTTPDSPATNAGLKRGDIILKYGDVDIVDSNSLINKLYRAHPTDPFEMLIHRDGHQMTIMGKFGYVPKSLQETESEQVKGSNSKLKLGVSMRELLPAELLELQSTTGIEGGVLIADVTPGSRAARAGLYAGDLITNLHQESTVSISTFSDAVNGLPETGVVTVEVIRSGIPVIIGLRIE